MNSTITLQSFESGIVQQITVATVSQTGERGPKGETGTGIPDVGSLSNQDFLRYNESAEDFEAVQLGSAAYSQSDDFATAAQGQTADTAVQPNDNISTLTNDANYIDATGAPVQSVNAQTGNVSLSASDVGAYADTNPDGYIDASGAPVQSVDGLTGAVDLSGEYDSLGSASAVQSNLTDHENATTSVHGIADTSDLIVEGDSRLTDQRVPTDGSVTSAKIDAAGLSPSAIAGTAVVDNDSRLTDTRTPTDGTVTDAKITSGGLSPSSVAGTSVIDNDSRLSDERTPKDASVTNAKVATNASIAQSKISGLESALDGKANLVGGKVPQAELPALALTEVFSVADIAARDALTVQEGDVAIVQDAGAGESASFIYDGSQWKELLTPTDGVTSVAGTAPISSTGGNNPTITLDDLGVDNGKIADEAITDGKIASGGLSPNKITGTAVVQSDIGTIASQDADNVAITGGDIDADLAYDNTNSTLTATLAQTAIDELDLKKLDVSALTSSVTFFATTASGAVGGYNRLVIDSGDSDYDEPAVAVTVGPFSGTDQLLGSLVSDAGVLDGNTTPINVTTIGNVRRSSGNNNDVADFYFEVYKRDSGGTETLIGTSSNSAEVNSTSFQEFYADALISDTLFTATDRVVLKFYGNVRSGGGGETYEFQYGGNQPVRTLFPVPVNVVPSVTTASDLQVDASGFSGLLSGTDDDAQTAFESLDQASLNDLSNVNITSPQAGDVLQFDGTNWVNVQLTDTNQDFYTVSSS